MKRFHQIKIVVASWIVRLIFTLSRFFSLGEGSNFPGKVILKIFPDILTFFLQRFKHGWILITGTNGKTTTTKILVDLLREHGLTVVTNARGANLIPGILTSLLVSKLNLDAEFMGDYAVFEVDEAVLIKSFQQFNPTVLVVTNFSRDQLDRYGEVDSNVNHIMEAIRQSGSKCKVVLNGNDPNVTRIGALIPSGRRVYFGLKEEMATSGSGLFIENEIGKGVAGEAEPVELDVWADHIQTEYLKGSFFNIHSGEWNIRTESKLPGVFNILNVLAAVGVCTVIGHCDLSKVQTVLSRVEPSYGRSERFEYHGKPIYLFLVKNPVGFNHIIQLLTKAEGQKRILFLLNDLAADGTDVSWIWDVSLENLWSVPGILEVVTGGTRAGDMALRVKYSNPPREIPISTDYNSRKALRRILARLQKDENILVLANYTAMNQFRPFLVKLCR